MLINGGLIDVLKSLGEEDLNNIMSQMAGMGGGGTWMIKLVSNNEIRCGNCFRMEESSLLLPRTATDCNATTTQRILSSI